MVERADIKQWYDQWYEQKGEGAWRPFEAYPIFLEYLKVEPGKKLLDVGCGVGSLLLAASERGVETYGVDIADNAIKFSGKISPKSILKQVSDETLPFPDRQFDYITCLGVLEHFLDIPKGIREMMRVAKDDARFCIVVPNTTFIGWKLKLAKGTAQQDINETLKTLEEWTATFEKEGLQISTVLQDRWFMKRTRVFASPNPVTILKNLAFKIAWAVLPLRYTYQFVFLMTKKPARV